jgi:peptide-N4-(N-acetyl-beta-glucosaminyl)asparagine amidase
LAKLKSELALSMSYEDPAAQAEARKVIPIRKLENLAREKCQNDETLYRDFLLSELTNWFKNDFFTWFDSPKCGMCNIDMRNKGRGSATPQELSDGASVIEL